MTTTESQNFNQLILYAIWGFLNHKSINIINCSFVYIEHLRENKIQFQRENLSEYIKTYNQYIEDIESGRLFFKRESILCNYCEYRKFNHCVKED